MAWGIFKSKTIRVLCTVLQIPLRYEIIIYMFFFYFIAWVWYYLKALGKCISLRLKLFKIHFSHTLMWIRSRNVVIVIRSMVHPPKVAWSQKYTWMQIILKVSLHMCRSTSSCVKKLAHSMKSSRWIFLASFLLVWRF